jgi:hypothetical protein
LRNSAHKEKDQLPPLVDAAVTGMSENIMHISGVETMMGKTTAQSWQVFLVQEKGEKPQGATAPVE